MKLYYPEYFTLQELVSPIIYKTYGSFAWNFFNPDMLEDLDTLRKLWKRPLIINNWHKGGSYKESGLRCNIDSIVKSKTKPYMSGHVLGRAFDIKSLRVTRCEDLYLMIIDEYRNFKTISRIEDIKNAPTWCHVDNLIERKEFIHIF